MISLLAIGTLAASCAGTSVENGQETKAQENRQPETQTSVPENAEPTEIEKRQLLSDHLEEQDFGGREFRIVTAETRAAEVDVETQTGEVCNDAIFNRNARIEERFNCSIGTILHPNFDEANSAVQKFVRAGMDEAELLYSVDFKVYVLANAKVIQNWTEIPNIDLTQPWYNRLANDGSTLNHILYACCSDFSVSALTETYAVFYNTRLTDSYDWSSEYLCNLVNDGKWTIDTLISMTKDLRQDLNGDGKRDENDLYGFGYRVRGAGDAWLIAFGGSYTSINADGTLNINFMNEKTVDALRKLQDYQWYSEGFYEYETSELREPEHFLNGQLVFAPLTFDNAFTTLRNMEDNYSVLPYPKWDEAQTEYYTGATDAFFVSMIPLTADDTGFIGTVFEALSAESYKTVYPVYYDVALKGKYSSDQSMADMIDLIMNGRKFDFAFQYGESQMQRMPYLFRDLLIRNQGMGKEIASEWAAIEQKLNKKLQKLYDIYDM